MMTKQICVQYKASKLDINAPKSMVATNMLEGYIAPIERLLDDIITKIEDVKALLQLNHSKSNVKHNILIITKAKINELKKDKTFKISTRNILGVNSGGDWIEDTNIGNIMRI